MTEDEEPKKLLEIQRLSVIPPPFLTSTLEPTTETPKDVAQHKSLIHLPSPEANKADDSKDLAIIERSSNPTISHLKLDNTSSPSSLSYKGMLQQLDLPSSILKAN
ncbi:uncharacterized protein LOC114294423 [Camellia sinensis]|uniref:uncharacterized protein LOC114294423 n=1 Tax=Camellia sinensis TaxID=4442 RepID=UPI001035CFE3|nr:uncharacterized protein LOC114294423 [Camellia sinensis]